MRDHAAKRNGDGVVCDGIGRLMETVEYMPAQFWGDLPWSDEWRKGWRTCSAWRREDGTNARDLLIGTSDAVFQALADYTDTDQRASVEITLSDEAQGLAPYLGADARDDNRWRTGSYAPGGNHHYRGYEDPPHDPLKRTRPGNPDLYDDPAHGGPTDNYSLPPADGLDDALWNQMSKHGGFLGALEGDARDAGIKVAKFYTDYFVPTLETRPVKVEQYGDEVTVARCAYDGVLDTLAKDRAFLPGDWTGDGGRAYAGHAASLENYLTKCRDKAKHLADDAEKAGGILRTLRDEYASLIKEYAPKLREQYNEFLDAQSGFLGLVRGLWNADREDVADGLARILLAFTKEIDAALSTKKIDANGLAASLVGASAAHSQMPKIGDTKRDLPVPVPKDEDPAWRDPTRW
ncbi:MAG: hypothetical protein ACRDTU_05755 [Micromonosporaceae bacterium]